MDIIFSGEKWKYATGEHVWGSCLMFFGLCVSMVFQYKNSNADRVKMTFSNCYENVNSDCSFRPNSQQSMIFSYLRCIKLTFYLLAISFSFVGLVALRFLAQTSWQCVYYVGEFKLVIVLFPQLDTGKCPCFNEYVACCNLYMIRIVMCISLLFIQCFSSSCRNGIWEADTLLHVSLFDKHLLPLQFVLEKLK